MGPGGDRALRSLPAGGEDGGTGGGPARPSHATRQPLADRNIPRVSILHCGHVDPGLDGYPDVLHIFAGR